MQLNQIVEIGNSDAGSGFIVIGTVLLFHIDDEVYENGHFIRQARANWKTRW